MFRRNVRKRIESNLTTNILFYNIKRTQHSKITLEDAKITNRAVAKTAIKRAINTVIKEFTRAGYVWIKILSVCF